MVRVARVNDLPRVTYLAKQFLIEAGYPDEISAKCAPGQVELVVNHPSPIPLVLVNSWWPSEDGDRAERIDGFFGAIVGEHPMTGIVTAFELAWFVAPECRRGTGGVKLLVYAEQLARKLGAQQMQLSALNDQVGGFLRRRGYTARETTYVRSLV